jgi:hypothetical protein
VYMVYRVCRVQVYMAPACCPTRHDVDDVRLSHEMQRADRDKGQRQRDRDKGREGAEEA